MATLAEALANYYAQQHNRLLSSPSSSSEPQLKNRLLKQPAPDPEMNRLAQALKPKTRSMSEDEVYFGYNPIDDLRRNVNVGSFTPEQARQNRLSTGYEVLGFIPGPGNVISAHDAYTSGQSARNALAEGNYRGAAVDTALAGLSALGAVLGLPVGKYAKRAAEAGRNTLFSGVRGGVDDLPMDDASRLARAKRMGYADEPFYRGEATGTAPQQYAYGDFSRDAEYAKGFAQKGGAVEPREFRLNLKNAFDLNQPITAGSYGKIVAAAAERDPKLAADLAESIAPGKGVDWVVGFGKARPDFVVVEKGGAPVVYQSLDRGSSDVVGLLRAAGYDAIDSGRDVRKLAGDGIRLKDARFDPSKASSKNIMAGVAGASLLPAWMLTGEPTSHQD
jgi:hypothetical protein